MIMYLEAMIIWRKDKEVIDLRFGDIAYRDSGGIALERPYDSSYRFTRQGAGMGVFRLTFLFLLLVLTVGCGDECTKYSDFNCDEIQAATYNIYFYYPSQSEAFLGGGEGLGQCETKAYRFAASEALENNSEWSYICCMKAKGSECYEKHR
jgi:hypothetical protein